MVRKTLKKKSLKRLKGITTDVKLSQTRKTYDKDIEKRIIDTVMKNIKEKELDEYTMKDFDKFLKSYYLKTGANPSFRNNSEIEEEIYDKILEKAKNFFESKIALKANERDKEYQIMDDFNIAEDIQYDIFETIKDNYYIDRDSLLNYALDNEKVRRSKENIINYINRLVKDYRHEYPEEEDEGAILAKNDKLDVNNLADEIVDDVLKNLNKEENDKIAEMLIDETFMTARDVIPDNFTSDDDESFDYDKWKAKERELRRKSRRFDEFENKLNQDSDKLNESYYEMAEKAQDPNLSRQERDRYVDEANKIMDQFNDVSKQMIKNIEDQRKNSEMMAKLELMKRKKHGDGFFDNVKNLFSNSKSQKTEEMIKKYGDYHVTELRIHRTPVEKVLQKIMNAISSGKWDKEKSNYQYDDIYHLYLYLKLVNDNGDVKYFMTEKSPNILWENRSSLHSDSSKGNDLTLTVNPVLFKDVIASTKKNMGSNFHKYSASNNCQIYVLNLLKSIYSLNGMELPDEIHQFIWQDIEPLLSSTSKNTANVVTGLSHAMNRLRGYGKRQYKRGGDLSSMIPIVGLASNLISSLSKPQISYSSSRTFTPAQIALSKTAQGQQQLKQYLSSIGMGKKRLNKKK